MFHDCFLSCRHHCIYPSSFRRDFDSKFNSLLKLAVFTGSEFVTLSLEIDNLNLILLFIYTPFYAN